MKVDVVEQVEIVSKYLISTSHSVQLSIRKDLQSFHQHSMITNMINVIEKRTRRKQEKCDISKYLRNDSGYPINYFICEKGNFMNRTYRILYDANLRFMVIALIIFGLV